MSNPFKKGYGGTKCGVNPVLTGRESFSRTRQLTSEAGRGFYTMEKYKTSICALLVSTSIVGYSNIILASTNKVPGVSGKNTYISSEAAIPKSTVSVKTENDKLEGTSAEKAANEVYLLADNENDGLINAKKAEAARLAAKKAEETKIAAKKAEEAKIAAKKAAEASAAKKAKAAKLAAEKAEKAKLAAKKAAAAKSTKKLVASRGTSTSAVSREKAKEIIDYAEQFMGVKYVFGGSSPSGFDCSGFTMYVFKKFGISLPHSARSQAQLGSAVSKNELMPGDLVFFETYQSGISHVGIYIGGGNFIEASSSRGIAITSLSSSYYKNRYLGATRIIK